MNTNDVKKSTGQTKRQERARQQQRRRSLHRLMSIGGALALIAIVAVGVWVYQGQSPSSSASGIPGPKGGPSIAQDVNTMVGQQAPSFTLADADDKEYAVTPGSGRPVVLVFHMGIT